MAIFIAYLFLYTCENTVVTWLSILAISSLLLIACIGPDSKWLNNKPLNVIGKYSFEIYLCHMLIFRVLEKAHLTDLISNPQINYPVVVISGLICATFFAIAFNYVWDKFRTKLAPSKSK